MLAQLTAGAFGTGRPFYVSNLSVTLVLGFAANTSFGGLPVLMSLLAKDNRLPHLFGLRAERPVFRYGVCALALMAALLLIVIGADTKRLLPLFAIGVFIGFTVSQVGLVQHWRRDRGAGWKSKAAINGAGAIMTAIAAVVFFASKFAEGAWARLPPVSRLAGLALDTAARLGGRVIPIAVDVVAAALRARTDAVVATLAVPAPVVARAGRRATRLGPVHLG